MKKTLLLALLPLTFSANAQSLTQANEATVGTTYAMQLCDSFTVDYDGVTGAGVTWDYTGLIGFAGETRDVTVIDASTSPYYSDFAGSVTAITVGNGLTTFFSSSPTERVSQGFAYDDGSTLYKARFTSDVETVATYPFANGSSLTDAFGGTIDFNFGGPQSVTANGSAYAWIDGQGTLELPGGVVLTDVIRYKIIDTSWANIPLVGNMEFIRRQYEYYDHTVTNLPVLMRSTIIIQNVGAPNPVTEETLVLSRYTPDNWANVEELDELNIKVFPNPTTDKITIQGDYTSDATAVLLDNSGREVKSVELTSNTIDMSDLSDGMYILKVSVNGTTSSTNVIKK